jgi:hypothetical protein
MTQKRRIKKGEIKWHMKAETGPCSMRSALNVANPARFLSNQVKGDLCTAGTATNRKRDSENRFSVLERIVILEILLFFEDALSQERIDIA